MEITGFVTLEGLPEFVAMLNRAADVVVKMAEDAVIAGTEAGVAEVNKNPPWTPQTGKLQKGRAKLLIALRDGAVGQMKWTAPYASFMEEGTRPHEIHPKLGAEGPLRGKTTTVRKKDGWQFSRATQKRRSSRDVGTSRTKLRWMGPGGKWIFALFVKHPGTQPKPFEDQAKYAAADAMLRIVNERMLILESIFGAG